MSHIPHSGLQLKLRAIKDHLADTISTIPGLLENENFAALHFYFANFTGMRREIYPEAIDAYNNWVNTKDLTIFEKLCNLGKNKWLDIATDIKQSYLKDQTIDANNVELLLAN